MLNRIIAQIISNDGKIYIFNFFNLPIFSVTESSTVDVLVGRRSLKIN